MKKTLAILLSLALVICMIPATASVAFAGTNHLDQIYGKVSIGSDEYTVSLTNNSVVYNGSNQSPTLKLTKGNEQYNGGVTLSYIDKNDGSASEVVAVSNAGTYKVIASISEDKWYVGDFTIKKYSFDGITIAIENQTSEHNNMNALPASGVKFSRGTSAITNTTEISLIETGLGVSVSRTNNRYTVSFSVKSGQEANYEGNIPPTSFDYVLGIDGDKTQVRKANGVDPIAQIDGGDYNNQDKKLQDLFTLYYKLPDSSYKKLTYGTDYTFTCSDTKNVGTHVVTIKGKGEYGGSKGINFVISGRDADTYVKADSIADQTEYTLHYVKPVLRDTGLGKVLEEGKDYQITAYNGTAGSKGYVTVSFIGNYTGTARDIEFNVVSNDKNVETFDVYYGSEKISTAKAFPNAYMYNAASQPVSGITVYTDYANKKTLSTYNYDVVYEYTADAKTVSTTAPVDAKTYSVYIVGKNGFAGKKYIGTYTIPKYNMQYVTVSVSMASAASVPSVTVKSIYENITFVKDKDYTMSYYVSSSTGKVQVTVSPTLNGNLTGSPKTDYYPIVAKSIASCSVSFTNGRSSAAYTGSAIPVDVTVKDGYYTPLTKGTHYTVTYKNAAGTKVTSIRDAGTYTVEINGIGGYNGTTYLTFTVIGTDISGYTVTLKNDSVNATGYSQTPVISSVKKGYSYSLTSNDYTVSYQDSTGKAVTSMSAPGTYKVVVTGKNGYSGSTYAYFRIVGLPQTLTVTKDSYKVYTTSDSFAIKASATGDGTGFTYTSSNPAVASVSSTGVVTPHKVGRAVITVATSGNKKYEPASETVEVKVYPKKGYITKSPWTDGKKAQMKVRARYQSGATKYQFRYSRDKNFRSGTYKTKTVYSHNNDKYTTQTTTIKGLKSGYTYYFKVRAVYTDPVTGDTYYGSWSSVRSAKVK